MRVSIPEIPMAHEDCVRAAIAKDEGLTLIENIMRMPDSDGTAMSCGRGGRYTNPRQPQETR
jgi:hypothetical protein